MSSGSGSCCGGNGETLIFTCAGAAYSGQVANRTGVQLMEQGAGSLFCIAAVAAGIDQKMERARHAGTRVALDGCEDQCVRKTLEKAGLSAHVHVVLTEMGVEKKPAQPNMISDAKKVVDLVKQKLGLGGASKTGCCG
ncbi:MAG: putative zinc-binding protein [Phycisphaerae bacterium]|nr:putative zinc-binding protein [Phycisphaerae bacterium]